MLQARIYVKNLMDSEPPLITGIVTFLATAPTLQSDLAITGKAEEKGVERLFQRSGTVLSKDSFQGVDDFEVVAYLIVLGDAEDPE